MKNIANVSEVVEKVLIEQPYVRAKGNDACLYVEVCKIYNPDVAYMGFEYVFNNRKKLGIPCFESVRRSRQKIQQDNESLRPSQEVIEGRYEAFKAVREYVEYGKKL